MEGSVSWVIAIVLVALVFDFINGFHDSANSIATVVSTRVLTPGIAVVWAAFFNVVAAFVVGTAVAKTIGKGLIDPAVVDPRVVLAGLLGAILWDLITWYLGLPTSSSHALLGGYGGAAIAKAGFGALLFKGWVLPIVFIVVSPLLGLVLALTLTVALSWLLRSQRPGPLDKVFRRLQLVSAALYSLSHGANDAQKTMGIIVGLLVSAQALVREPDRLAPPSPCTDGRPYSAVGRDVGLYRDRVRHRARRVANSENHGNPDHQAASVWRILRGDGRRSLHPDCLVAGRTGQHHPHDHRRDRGSRGGSASLGGPLGCGEAHRVGVDSHDAHECGDCGGGVLGLEIAIGYRLSAIRHWSCDPSLRLHEPIADSQ